MSKTITQGHAARLKIKAGIDKACDAVRPTLGAVGMEAVIEVPGLDPIHCDDGVTILKHLDFKDKHEQLGLQMLRKAALRTSSEGGDGTATTTVLTQALVAEAFKEIANDSSKIREVRERLGAGLASVLEELSKLKREVKEEDVVRHISNVTRYAALYIYGGIWLDHDVVPLCNLFDHTIENSVTGFNEEREGCFMRFESGHPFLEEALRLIRSKPISNTARSTDVSGAPQTQIDSTLKFVQVDEMCLQFLVGSPPHG